MTVTNVVAVVLLLISCWTDIKYRIIPNFISILLIVNYFIGFFIGIETFPLFDSVLAFAIILVSSTALYAFGWLGGGDVKLVSSASFYVGLQNLPVFTILIGLFGGFLSIFYLIFILYQKKFKSHKNNLQSDGLFIASPDEKKIQLPYGVAIACATLVVIFMSGYPN